MENVIKTGIELDPEFYTKDGKLRKRRRKKSRNYFTQDTEDAIVEYLNCTDELKRNEIFNSRIYYSFYKLAENLINTFKFYYMEVDHINDLIHEVMTFLMEKLHHYKQDKGKAYSYFGTVAKRYLIIYNDANYKKLKVRAQVDEVEEDKTITRNLINSNSDGFVGEVTDLFVQYMEKNMNKVFKSETDRQIAECLLEVFRRRENLEVINKQSVYLYIREMTNKTAPDITKVTKEMKKIYRDLLNKYYDVGEVEF